MKSLTQLLAIFLVFILGTNPSPVYSANLCDLSTPESNLQTKSATDTATSTSATTSTSNYSSTYYGYGAGPISPATTSLYASGRTPTYSSYGSGYGAAYVTVGSAGGVVIIPSLPESKDLAAPLLEVPKAVENVRAPRDAPAFVTPTRLFPPAYSFGAPQWNSCSSSETACSLRNPVTLDIDIDGDGITSRHIFNAGLLNKVTGIATFTSTTNPTMQITTKTVSGANIYLKVVDTAQNFTMFNYWEGSKEIRSAFRVQSPHNYAIMMVTDFSNNSISYYDHGDFASASAAPTSLADFVSKYESTNQGYTKVFFVDVRAAQLAYITNGVRFNFYGRTNGTGPLVSRVTNTVTPGASTSVWALNGTMVKQRTQTVTLPFTNEAITVYAGRTGFFGGDPADKTGKTGLVFTSSDGTQVVLDGNPPNFILTWKGKQYSVTLNGADGTLSIVYVITKAEFLTIVESAGGISQIPLLGTIPNSIKVTPNVQDDRGSIIYSWPEANGFTRNVFVRMPTQPGFGEVRTYLTKTLSIQEASALFDEVLAKLPTPHPTRTLFAQYYQKNATTGLYNIPASLSLVLYQHEDWNYQELTWRIPNPAYNPTTDPRTHICFSILKGLGPNENTEALAPGWLNDHAFMMIQ